MKKEKMFDDWVYKCLKCKHSYYKKKDEEEMFCRLKKCKFKEKELHKKELEKELGGGKIII